MRISIQLIQEMIRYAELEQKARENKDKVYLRSNATTDEINLFKKFYHNNQSNECQVPKSNEI